MPAQLRNYCSQCPRHFPTVLGLRDHEPVHTSSSQIPQGVASRHSALPSPRWDSGSRALPEQWWG